MCDGEQAAVGLPFPRKLQQETSRRVPGREQEKKRARHRHVVPQRGDLRLDHPSGYQLRLTRELLELPSDAQQLVVLLPADEQTAQAVDQLRRRSRGGLRAIS